MYEMRLGVLSSDFWADVMLRMRAWYHRLGHGRVRVLDVRQRNVGCERELHMYKVRRRDVVERERGLMRLVRCGQVVGLGGERMHGLQRW